MSTTHRARPGLICVLGLALAGCAEDATEGQRFACVVERDCQAGWFCVAQVCSATSGPDARLTDHGAPADRGLPGDRGLPADAAPDGHAGAGGAGGMAGAGGIGGEGGMGGEGGQVGLDSDGDGVPDAVDTCPLEPNPSQDPAYCAACQRNADCFIGLASPRCIEIDTCGGRFARSRVQGVCLDNTCGRFGQPEDVVGECPAGTRCQDGAGGARCAANAACGVECRLDNEGTACGGPDHRRCRDGVCQPWSCEAIECNEAGPSPPTIPGILMLQLNAGVIVDGRTGSRWRVLNDRALDLTEAHQLCAAADSGDAAHPWRLPTWYELATVARRNPLDDAMLQAVGWPLNDALYLSRTVVDQNLAMALHARSGELRQVPRIAMAGSYAVACIATPERPRDLAARRAAFAAAVDPVADPWTTLTWSRAPVAQRVSRSGAIRQCIIANKQLPTVNALLSAMTFAVPDPPGPGSWVAWDGAHFGRREGLVWAVDGGDEPAGDPQGWVVNLLTGEVRQQSVNQLADARCIQQP